MFKIKGLDVIAGKPIAIEYFENNLT